MWIIKFRGSARAKKVGLNTNSRSYICFSNYLNNNYREDQDQAKEHNAKRWLMNIVSITLVQAIYLDKN